MSEKEYEAFERYSIMSLQSDVGEDKAYKYVLKKYGKAIADKVKEKSK